jgi:PAS domain S-box-containing protein
VAQRSASGKPPWVRLASQPRIAGEGAADAPEAGEAAARFRALIEWLPVVVYEAEFGPHGAWRYVSPEIEALLGYSASEWTQDPELWLMRLHPDDRDEVIELERSDSELARTGELTMVMEYRLLHRDGHVVWVRDQARAVESGEAEAPYWSGVLIDITEARTAQTALSAEYERYRSLIHSLPVCLYQIDGERPGTRAFVSPQLNRLLGYTTEEWEADPGLWRKSLHPEDRDRVLKAEERQLAMPAGTSSTSEYRLLGRDQAIVWVRDRAVAALGPNGRPVIDGSLTDISAERGEAARAGQTSDLLRITCRECGSVHSADRLTPCPDCGSTDLDAVSLDATLAELAATRAQFERLLDGIHGHLEALGTHRGGSSAERAAGHGRPDRVLTRGASRSRPGPSPGAD